MYKKSHMTFMSTNKAKEITEDFGQNKIWVILPSPIQGVGVFARKWLVPGEMIGVGIVYTLGLIPRVTFFGGKLNHSYNANALLRYDKNTNTWNLYAAKDIAPGKEILLDYRDTPPFIAGPERHYV